MTDKKILKKPYQSEACEIFVACRFRCVLESAHNELSDMAGKQAKTLSTDHIDDLLFFAERSRHPLRNRLIVLLSVRAGLRAAEIAKLTWDMVLDPSGEISAALELQDKIAKKRSGRSIPLHADIRSALIVARQLCGGQGPVILSERGGAMTPMSIVVWFSRAYEALGFDGCSSHSGRRTFICSRSTQSWRFSAGRSAIGGASLDTDNTALY
jgi:integrase